MEKPVNIVMTLILAVAIVMIYLWYFNKRGPFDLEFIVQPPKIINMKK